MELNIDVLYIYKCCIDVRNPNIMTKLGPTCEQKADILPSYKVNVANMLANLFFLLHIYMSSRHAAILAFVVVCGHTHSSKSNADFTDSSF